MGNEEARAKLAAWLKRWKSGSKAALLVGPPGTGKTTTVHIMAAEGGLNLVELNASDARTKSKLSKKMGEATSSTSLLGEKTLIFLDEVDGLAGRSDYGAIDFIRDAVRGSENPIVMAANDPDADEVRKLANVSTKIEFKPPTTSEVLVFLRRIAEEEGTEADDASLHSIAESSRGDLRFALNALQSGHAGGKDDAMTAAQSVNAFFGAESRAEALRALRAYPGQPRDKLRDIFSSVVRAKLPAEARAEAMRALSEADLLMGRMLRGKDWRLLRYLDGILAGGLRAALAGDKVGYSQDGVPWPLQLRIWNDAKKVKELGLSAGRRLWIGSRGWAVEDFPYMARLCADRGFRETLVASLDLDELFDTFLAKESGRR